MRAIALALLTLGCTACTTRNPYGDWAWYYRPVEGSNVVPREQGSPYMLALFEGDTGAPLSWTDLWEGMHWADIVIVGELHDDANAHLVQLTLLEEALAAWPGSVLSMEMLERNEQPLVDAYVAGELELDAFIDQTGSRHWAGKDTWVRFYQPMIDAVKRAREEALAQPAGTTGPTDGTPLPRVVAANAPRQYVRLARTDGYEALQALPPEEQALFDLPVAPPPHRYRERFREFMTGDDGGPTEQQLDAGLRPQRVWDATMAQSVTRAYRALPPRAKLIHVVGQFHSEYDGGLVSEIQARAGSARILTVSVQRGETTALREGDRGKADVVVYGVRPAPTWSPARSRRQQTPAAEEAAPHLPTSEELPEWGVAY